jgi:hypothetical protein
VKLLTTFSLKACVAPVPKFSSQGGIVVVGSFYRRSASFTEVCCHNHKRVGVLIIEQRRWAEGGLERIEIRLAALGPLSKKTKQTLDGQYDWTEPRPKIVPRHFVRTSRTCRIVVGNERA